MIGILLALQVNNWNEATKMRNKEISVYKEILSELEETLVDLENDREDRTRNLDATVKIRNMFLGMNVPKDTFMNYIHYVYDSETASIKSSAFESLKSVGLDILTNDSLRQNISTLYQLNLPFLVNGYQVNESALFRRKIETQLNSYLRINDESILEAIDNERIGFSRNLRYLKIDNFDSLLKDDEFALTVQKSLLSQYAVIYAFGNVSQKIQKLIIDIEHEIKRLE